MRVTIVPADKLIIIDGVPMIVEADYPEGVHAVQWYGDQGEIEYTNAPGEPKPLNEGIDTLDAFEPLLAAYRSRIAEVEALKALEAEKAE